MSKAYFLFRQIIQLFKGKFEKALIISQNFQQRFIFFNFVNNEAEVAELADALDLGSSEATRGGSSPPFRTLCTSKILITLTYRKTK